MIYLSTGAQTIISQYFIQKMTRKCCTTIYTCYMGRHNNNDTSEHVLVLSTTLNLVDECLTDVYSNHEYAYYYAAILCTPCLSLPTYTYQQIQPSLIVKRFPSVANHFSFRLINKLSTISTAHI